MKKTVETVESLAAELETTKNKLRRAERQVRAFRQRRGLRKGEPQGEWNRRYWNARFNGVSHEQAKLEASR